MTIETIARTFTEAEGLHYPLGAARTATVWRYVLPSNQQSDGGTFLLDSAGMFASVSAYGGFAWRWNAFGRDFRRFFADRDPLFLYAKLHRPRRELKTRIDGVATARAIRKALWDRFGAGPVLDREVELLRAWGDLEDDVSFVGWSGETRLDEPWSFAVRDDIDQECRAFCTLLLPRLQARIRFDLARGRP